MPLLLTQRNSGCPTLTVAFEPRNWQTQRHCNIDIGTYLPRTTRHRPALVPCSPLSSPCILLVTDAPHGCALPSIFYPHSSTPPPLRPSIKIVATQITAGEGGVVSLTAHEAIPPSSMPAPHTSTPPPHAPQCTPRSYTRSIHDTFESTHCSDIRFVTAGEGHTTLAAGDSHLRMQSLPADTLTLTLIVGGVPLHRLIAKPR